MADDINTGVDFLKATFELADLREEYCKNAPDCEKCESKQVQFMACDKNQANWRCRHCRHVFITKRQK